MPLPVAMIAIVPLMFFVVSHPVISSSLNLHSLRESDFEINTSEWLVLLPARGEMMTFSYSANSEASPGEKT